MTARERILEEITKVKAGDSIKEFKKAVCEIERIIIEDMSPSRYREVKDELEKIGHLDKAARKYFQVYLKPNDDSVNHYLDG